ncbi:unnamed protein product, partial [Nesidiocoris tenuis]
QTHRTLHAIHGSEFGGSNQNHELHLLRFQPSLISVRLAQGHQQISPGADSRMRNQPGEHSHFPQVPLGLRRYNYHHLRVPVYKSVDLAADDQHSGEMDAAARDNLGQRFTR